MASDAQPGTGEAQQTLVERAEPSSLLQPTQCAHTMRGQSEREPPYLSIPDLARRWRCSRASVYNRLRGERILDFAPPGHRGHKLVSIETVRKIERRHMKVLR